MTPLSKPAAAQGWKKVIVTTMKNEGPYILEWIAYHRSIGFDGFVIYSNDCSDGTNLILNRLDQMGVIVHFDNPQGPNMDPQRSAYSRANVVPEVQQADWVLVIDADEFLNVKVGDYSVDALIAACPDGTQAISVNWRLMGSCGHARWSDELITERFTRGSSFEKPENGLVWGFKTLFRAGTFDYLAVHRPRFHKTRELKPGMVNWVNGDGLPMGEKYLQNGWRSNAQNLGYELAQVNHYAVKSREEFLLKRLRGTANSKNKDRISLEYWEKYDINTFEDRSIHTDGIKAEMKRLLKNADLAALVRATKESVRRTIAYQIEDPKLRVFVERGELNLEAA